jgi:DNA helicase-2/ATP-dependent DNA helicase PcrA
VEMSFSPEIIIGPPGTGKTRTLLGEVDEALQNDIPPNRIGFLAFTKKAAEEAIERAKVQFNFSDSEMPYFRTLHSFAFRSLGLKKSRVLGNKDLREFGDILGLRLTGLVNAKEGSVYGYTKGDRAMFISSLSRLRRVSVEDQWRIMDDYIGWREVERVHLGLIKYKESRGLFDFTDMLEVFIERGASPELDLLLVDEAQDLSRLQWQMVAKLAGSSKRVVVAGDDDQAIFQWAGADLKYFIGMKGSVRVLEKSYRTPQIIQDSALSLITRVSSRREKQWASREGEGTISYHTSVDNIDMSEGTWLILARNNYLLEEAELLCRRQGLMYERHGKRSASTSSLETIRAWESLRKGNTVNYREAQSILLYITGKKLNLLRHSNHTLKDLHTNYGIPENGIWHEVFQKMSLYERAYLIAARKRGEKPSSLPRIRLSTIHSAKGGEADNVILYSDMARRTFKDMQMMPDNEKRVFYVGITRAKENLFIIVPRTKYFFLDL